MLKVFNTLTGQKEEFIPIDNMDIKMYVCGPTVYSRPHIGNMRSVVVYDVIYSLFILASKSFFNTLTHVIYFFASLN